MPAAPTRKRFCLLQPMMAFTIASSKSMLERIRTWLVVALAMLPVLVLAAEIEISNPQITASEDGYVVSADFSLELNERLEEAVTKGVVLYFVTEFEMTRPRWYWKKEATDWGWDWASEKDKYLHPKYAPVNRYATDIIGCLNNRVDGWIDWNMVLDKQGGPNWFKNWCIAPVIVDVEKDEVYFTPLYYTMAHFSKFIRPGAVKIGCSISNKELIATAVKNPDGSIAIVVFNPTDEPRSIEIIINKINKNISISAKALQTVLIKS